MFKGGFPIGRLKKFLAEYTSLITALVYKNITPAWGWHCWAGLRLESDLILYLLQRYQVRSDWGSAYSHLICVEVELPSRYNSSSPSSLHDWRTSSPGILKQSAHVTTLDSRRLDLVRTYEGLSLSVLCCVHFPFPIMLHNQELTNISPGSLCPDLPQHHRQLCQLD